MCEPTAIPVVPETGRVGAVIAVVPERIVHSPVPTVGVFPARMVEVLQMFWSNPALAVVGGVVVLLVIMISSVEVGQEPPEIVHLSVVEPKPIAVSPELGEEGVVIVAVPEILVHVPVPVVATLPASVVVVAQIT